MNAAGDLAVIKGTTCIYTFNFCHTYMVRTYVYINTSRNQHLTNAEEVRYNLKRREKDHPERPPSAMCGQNLNSRNQE